MTSDPVPGRCVYWAGPRVGLVHVSVALTRGFEGEKAVVSRSGIFWLAGIILPSLLSPTSAQAVFLLFLQKIQRSNPPNKQRTPVQNKTFLEKGPQRFSDSLSSHYSTNPLQLLKSHPLQLGCYCLLYLPIDPPRPSSRFTHFHPLKLFRFQIPCCCWQLPLSLPLVREWPVHSNLEIPLSSFRLLPFSCHPVTIPQNGSDL